MTPDEIRQKHQELQIEVMRSRTAGEPFPNVGEDYWNLLEAAVHLLDLMQWAGAHLLSGIEQTEIARKIMVGETKERTDGRD